MSTEQLLKAKKWILSNPHVITHAGRKHYIEDEVRLVDGKKVVYYTPKGLDSMNAVECLDELNLFGGLWANITGVPQCQFHPDDALPAMKTHLKWYYSTEAHSLLLRWITFALAVSEQVNAAVYKEDTNEELIPDNTQLADEDLNVVEQIENMTRQMMI